MLWRLLLLLLAAAPLLAAAMKAEDDAAVWRGVDMSQIGTEDDNGQHSPFRASAEGLAEDPLALMRQAGVNTFRMRMWNDPCADGRCNASQVTAKAAACCRDSAAAPRATTRLSSRAHLVWRPCAVGIRRPAGRAADGAAVLAMGDAVDLAATLLPAPPFHSGRGSVNRTVETVLPSTLIGIF